MREYVQKYVDKFDRKPSKILLKFEFPKASEEEIERALAS